MIKEFTKQLTQYFKSISNIEYTEKSHQTELIGTYMVDGKEQDVICTVQMKHYIPRDVYGEPGYFYEKPRRRKVRDKDRNWIIINEIVKYYELSEADKKFIYVSYVHHHLNQRQISKLSGIPQPYIFRYIKHNKLKPKYHKIEKSKRYKTINEEMGVPETTLVFTDIKETPVEIPEDMDFGEPFHLDPFPARSEWKVRREELGLKNGENWRNTSYDENPGPRQYGDGSKSRRKKEAKQKRREERRIRNIKKFNTHQNNRYGITDETK